MQRNYRLLATLAGVLCAAVAFAQSAEERIQELQSQMYKQFYLDDTLAFFKTTEQLKQECLAVGDEQTYYKAWGNQAIFESTHQRRTQALAVAREMDAYAHDKGSKYGLYTATHVMGVIYHQMRDYDEAEREFLKAVDYLHQSQPGESAAADYLELLLIAVNGKRDLEAGFAYAKKALAEPGITPQHKLRTLSMLCQMVGEGTNPDVEEFNRYYEQRRQVLPLAQTDRAEHEINVLHALINKQYDEALRLTDELRGDIRPFLTARIYHEMGNDSKAYANMLLYKQVRDSLTRAEQSGLLSEYIMQLNNERIESERLALEKEADSLRSRYWYTLAVIVVVLLAYVIYRRYRTIHRLELHNAQLDEARRAEQAAREEAEKALDVKREFLNNISHELRTPLNPITGFSDILATPGFELAPQEREAMSQHIKDSSKVLTGIIDNMIELSFYESKSSLAKEDVIAPNIICMQVADELRPKCHQGVQLAYISDLTDDDVIRTDLQSTQKVLRQLLTNAIKFTEQGSIVMHCAAEGDLIRITVTDTGCGIDAERREHLFEPFIKTADNVKTTGFGLSISQSIAKLLGGRVYLDADYTQGARFVFEMPRQ